MRHECGPYLSTRPPFLLPAELPYDDLLRSPERFTGRPGRTSGCTFGSVEGRETPRGHVLQWRILFAVECLLATLSRGCYLAPGAGHLIISHLLTEVEPSHGWSTASA